MKEYRNCSLLPYNTFGMDVKANIFVEYTSVEELMHYLSKGIHQTVPVLHIGGGSNLLFTHDFEGLIMHSAIHGFQVLSQTDSQVQILAGAGEKWDDFVAYTVENGWYGAENLSLIPGEVGASAVQNIGAYGVEVKDIIAYVDTVEISTLKPRRFSVEECQYAYRSSIFKHQLKGKYIVTHVCYTLSKKPQYHIEYGNIRLQLEKTSTPLSLSNLRQVIIDIRNSKLPAPEVTGNAGSFFMNPVISKDDYQNLLKQYPSMPCYQVSSTMVKVPAGWLIDQCGWKGKAIGRAAVHDKQALVLVNKGGATGLEILYLAQQIISSVNQKFGITISPEVNYI